MSRVASIKKDTCVTVDKSDPDSQGATTAIEAETAASTRAMATKANMSSAAALGASDSSMAFLRMSTQSLVLSPTSVVAARLHGFRMLKFVVTVPKIQRSASAPRPIDEMVDSTVIVGSFFASRSGGVEIRRRCGKWY